VENESSTAAEEAPPPTKLLIWLFVLGTLLGISVIANILLLVSVMS